MSESKQVIDDVNDGTNDDYDMQLCTSNSDEDDSGELDSRTLPNGDAENAEEAYDYSARSFQNNVSN